MMDRFNMPFITHQIVADKLFPVLHEILEADCCFEALLGDFEAEEEENIRRAADELKEEVCDYIDAQAEALIGYGRRQTEREKTREETPKEPLINHCRCAYYLWKQGITDEIPKDFMGGGTCAFMMGRNWDKRTIVARMEAAMKEIKSELGP